MSSRNGGKYCGSHNKFALHVGFHHRNPSVDQPDSRKSQDVLAQYWSLSEIYPVKKSLCGLGKIKIGFPAKPKFAITEMPSVSCKKENVFTVINVYFFNLFFTHTTYHDNKTTKLPFRSTSSLRIRLLKSKPRRTELSSGCCPKGIETLCTKMQVFFRTMYHYTRCHFIYFGADFFINTNNSRIK